eukprot:scaffold15186_cov96-Isochrysis_galbana.AAC.1
MLRAEILIGPRSTLGRDPNRAEIQNWDETEASRCKGEEAAGYATAVQRAGRQGDVPPGPPVREGGGKGEMRACVRSIVEMVRCHFLHRASETPARCVHSTCGGARGTEAAVVKHACLGAHAQSHTSGELGRGACRGAQNWKHARHPPAPA